MSRISTDLHVGGTLSADTMTIPAATLTNIMIKGDADIARSKLAQEELVRHFIPWDAWRVWDALATNLPGTAANDDLGLVTGTLASASPSIRTSDADGTTVTQYARASFALPAEYDAGETVHIRAHTGLTTAAASSATIHFQVYKSDSEEGVGSDLVTTAATSINSTTLAAKDFSITSTGLSAGDVLDIRVDVAVTGTGACFGVIGGVWMLIDVRG